MRRLKKLTVSYVKRTLRPDSYWLASTDGCLEDIVFHIPKKATKIQVRVDEDSNRSSIHVIANVKITSCCTYSKLTKQDPVILFPSDSLLNITKDQFEMMLDLLPSMPYVP